MLQGRMSLIDYFKGPLIRVDEALGEKFDYQPISKKIKNIIPPNIRQFGYDVFGGKEDFTEADLSPAYQEELKGIANKALMKGKDTITYADYEQGTMDRPLIKNLMSKNYNLKTLIGDGKITLNENGELIVTDRFDYNDAQDINSLEDVKNMFSGIVGAFRGDEGHYGSGGLYSAIREAAKYLGSAPGEGSDIKINLGKYEA
tara:strand:- start:68 stop:673 length:606 start_codon:yes stop_codon:yes gene_type:complete